MIGICSIGLLVLSTLTVYATPSTLYANGKQDHENLSDEDVANYFRNKFETEDVKPSMVLEYLVKLMGSEKSGSSIATTNSDDPVCLEGGSLKKSHINRILDTVHHGLATTTLVTADGGKTMHIDDTKPLNAFGAAVYSAASAGVVNNIWANYSPCPECVQALLLLLGKDTNKPTIHIGRIYIGDTFADMIESLQCLAKLKHEGFDIVPWDFSALRDTLTANDCKAVISERLGDDSFNTEYMKLVSYVNFIHQLSENQHASTWCTL